MRARPLPVRPDPHLPEGCDVGNLHDEAVLLAPLKPAGIGRPRRFSLLLLYSLSASPSRAAALALPTASNQKFMSALYWT